MKLENISLYNFANVINDLINLSDSAIGAADYDTVKDISNKKGRSVVDTIFLQYDNKMCEYCVIGNKDLQSLLSLKGTHDYWSAMNSIVVQMTVSASPEWWKEFKDIVGDKFLAIKQGDYYTLIMTYYDIRDINSKVTAKDENWDYFLSRINSLPYVQQLIL